MLYKFTYKRKSVGAIEFVMLKINQLKFELYLILHLSPIELHALHFDLRIIV